MIRHLIQPVAAVEFVYLAHIEDSSQLNVQEITAKSTCSSDVSFWWSSVNDLKGLTHVSEVEVRAIVNVIDQG